MKHLALLTVLAGTSATPPASEPSCVPANACGCSIVVTGSTCPGGSAHFFRELMDGSPLHLGSGQNPITATSTQARSEIVSPGPGDSWVETYRYDAGSITIRYSPGANTCPKVVQGEQCEYFDVRATVQISDPQGTRQYSGTGRCGC